MTPARRWKIASAVYRRAFEKILAGQALTDIEAEFLAAGCDGRAGYVVPPSIEPDFGRLRPTGWRPRTPRWLNPDDQRRWRELKLEEQEILREIERLRWKQDDAS